MRWPVSPLVFGGMPRGDTAAYAPGDSLPGHAGLVPAGAGRHAAAVGRPFSHGLLPTPPGGGGRRSCHTLGSPRGPRPRASCSRLCSAAARRERAEALRARFAGSMGHHRPSGAETWARVSAAAADPDPKVCRPRGGPVLSKGPASDRTEPPSACAPGMKCLGSATLMARLGPPRLPSPPSLGLPGISPVPPPPSPR